MKTDQEYLDELLALRAKSHNFTANLSRFGKFKELKQWIIDKTTPLLDDPFYTLGNRIFYIINDVHELPRCANPNCRKVIKINFTSYTDKEEHKHCHCCVRCVQFDPDVKQKIEKTTLQRHNCRRGKHTTEVHEKMRQAFQKKYGVDNPLACKEIQEKCRQTVFDRYGVSCVFNAPEIKEKICATLSANYSVSCVFESPLIQEKRRQTLINRYGVSCTFDSPEIKAKIEKSMIENHGSRYFLGTDECAEKTRQFYMKNYGVDHSMKVPEIIEKKKQTNLERYGNEYGMAYGTEKYRQMMLERYGVETPMQSYDLRIKQQARYLYDGKSFDSAPEVAFYIYFSDHKIPVECSPYCEFWYTYKIDGQMKKSRYFPDFKVNKTYVELKGQHFISADGKRWICPFRYDDWSEQRYQDECDKYEAKHQCALKNGVVILLADRYQKYLDYVDQTYGFDYLKQFKTQYDE